jgi:hypothetical protein
MSNNYTFAGISIHVGNKLAHIFHLSLEVGDKQPDLHNFNQGTHFYYKIQLQLQIIRILLRGILISL